MSMTIALLCLLCLLLALLLLRHHPHYYISPSPSLPPPLPPLHTHRVSYTLPISPPSHRRWSSPLHKLKSPQPDITHDIIISSSPPSSPPKPARRLSTPLRLSFASKRRPSSASSTSTLIQVDTPTTQSPPRRTRFVNPFIKQSRTLSPPSLCESPDTPPSGPSGVSPPSSPPPRRTMLLYKFRSMFKSIPPEPKPSIQPKPILTTINSRLRRKPVARTQPYGPPWNAPMPVPDFTLSIHSFREPTQTASPFPQSSRKRSVHRPEISSGQLSPRTFISELDEKLSLLQQQRIQDSIPSPCR